MPRISHRMMRLTAAMAIASLLVLAAAPAQAQTVGASTAMPSGVIHAAPAGGAVEAILFYAIALAVVVSVLGICVSKSVVRMAIWLFGALISVALIYFLLAATFLGAIQLLVYAGGTMILLVFGVMLTSKSPWARFEISWVELVAGVVVSVTLFVALCTALGRTVWTGVSETMPGVAVADIGRSLLTTYLVPFEVAGVLLFVVMVGAAHLARDT